MIYYIKKIFARVKHKPFLITKLSIFEKIVDYIHDKYNYFVIIPYETICRFLFWGWKLRNNYNWDCQNLLYYMIYLKLDSLIKYSRKYGHLMWNNKENGTQFSSKIMAVRLLL